MGRRIISTPMLLSMAKSVSSYLLRSGRLPSCHDSKKVSISMPFLNGSSVLWLNIEADKKRRATITKSFLPPPDSTCSIFHIFSYKVVCIKRLYTEFSETCKSFKFPQAETCRECAKLSLFCKISLNAHPGLLRLRLAMTGFLYIVIARSVSDEAIQWW